MIYVGQSEGSANSIKIIDAAMHRAGITTTREDEWKNKKLAIFYFLCTFPYPCPFCPFPNDPMGLCFSPVTWCELQAWARPFVKENYEYITKCYIHAVVLG